MTSVILEGKAEFIKEQIDLLISGGSTINFIVKLEAGKVLVLYT